MWPTIAIIILCICIFLYARLRCAEKSLKYMDEQLEHAHNDCQKLWEENQILKARNKQEIPR